MEKITQGFSVDIGFPVYFTEDLFAAENGAFQEAITRQEPEKCHRVLFIIDQNVASAHPRLVTQIWDYTVAHAETMELLGEPLLVEGGESAKDGFAQVIRLVEEVNRLGIDRHSFMVIVGGGAVLDVACFAASIAHRGVRAVRIPTTVLAQSDSAVGVKSGINLFGKKNFAGTFDPPFAVLNDLRFIETLEHRDKIGGIAEAVKVALIRDREFFEYLEANVGGLSAATSQALAYPIQHAARLHLDHIRTSGDPFESGTARPLDFGHWSAHKLETMTRNRLRHGEAVAIGLALDAVYSVKAGHLEADLLERILALLSGIGLALWDEALLERNDQRELVVLEGLREFQEHIGGRLNIPLLRRIGESFDVNAMDQELVEDSILWLRDRFAPDPAQLSRKIATG